MKMRLLATLIVSWGLIGVPALCQGGILVECCEDACPDEGESSRPCECSACIAMCNAVVSHKDQVSNPSLERNVAQVDIAPNPISAWREPAQQGWPTRYTRQQRKNLPYPIPDRPLLV
jgi:hypothetical protein